MSSNLLLAHGVVELGAAALFFFATPKVFPYLKTGEQRTLGKLFSLAIAALAITALAGRFAPMATRMALAQGALFYHGSVTSLFLYQLATKTAADPKAAVGVSVMHGIFSFLFCRAVFA